MTVFIQIHKKRVIGTCLQCADDAKFVENVGFGSQEKNKEKSNVQMIFEIGEEMISKYTNEINHEGALCHETREWGAKI